MKGFIFLNAYFNIVEYASQAERIKEEFNNFGVECDIIRNDYGTLIIDENISTKLSNYDFCVYLDKDKYVLHALQTLKIPTFNNFSAIETCDDKMLTYLHLTNNGIKLPKTIPSVLCYDSNEKIIEKSLLNIEKYLGYPIIVKTCYGSRGKGVSFITSREQLLKKMNKLKTAPHLFQQFINESFGKDLRVIVIGGKVIGGILRQSEDDFRSNVALGGKATAIKVSEDIATVCEKCANILGLDYCGIDILLGKDNTPYVCEVNSNAFFYEFEKTTKINVAKAYTQHILKTLRNK